METETIINIIAIILGLLLTGLFYKYFFALKSGEPNVISAGITSYTEDFEKLLIGISTSQNTNQLMHYLCETFKFKRKYQEEKYLEGDIELLMDISCTKIEDFKKAERVASKN